MDDEMLDGGLKAVDPVSRVDEREQALLTQLVTQARDEVPLRRPARRRWRIGLGIGGFVVAGALIAGVNYQDYLLSIPPFAGLMDGEQRTTTGWVMTTVAGDDAGERCVLYPEFRRLEPDQFSKISEYVEENPDWDSLGADTAAAARIPVGATVSGSDDRFYEYIDVMSHVVHERVKEVLPGLPFRARITEPDGPADPPSFEGFTMSCLPGEADTQ